MHIVILINQTKQELTADIDRSRLKYWLKRSRVETLATSDVWSKLYCAFHWSDDQSLARSLTQQSGIHGHCLIATPVRVELGMRDSECHNLNQNDSHISDSQIENFNEFFTGVFQLHAFNGSHYLLEFDEFPNFHLDRQYWPPYLGDYRVQVQAAKGDLVKHLTEMQAWCYQQNSVWNALYLWSNNGNFGLPPVEIDDQSEYRAFSLLSLLSQPNLTSREYRVIACDDLSELEESFPELELQCRSGQIEQLIVSFADKELYRIAPESFKSWWRTFFGN